MLAAAGRRSADALAECPLRLVWAAGAGGRPGALDGRLFSYRHDLKGHTGAVYAVQFSPCGRYVATGSFDKSVRIWDATAPTEVRAHWRLRRCGRIALRADIGASNGPRLLNGAS